jgi:hypothetical protein
MATQPTTTDNTSKKASAKKTAPASKAKAAAKKAAASKPRKTAKPKAPTARDLGVPDAYLGPSGRFYPGGDARFKSDIILRALDQPAPKALVQFTQAEAIKLLTKFPQWKPALSKKKALLAAAATKAEAKGAKS